MLAERRWLSERTSFWSITVNARRGVALAAESTVLDFCAMKNPLLY
jgi:hypothetical protein